MAEKICTYAKSLYHQYSDFRGTQGTPSSDGVPKCAPADVQSFSAINGTPRRSLKLYEISPPYKGSIHMVVPHRIAPSGYF